ncbi:MAG: hypothetical protein ACKO5R_06230, partial [Planctomycetaceae bacterium]
LVSRAQARRAQARRALARRVLARRVLARRVLARRVLARRVLVRRVLARRVLVRRVLVRRVLARRALVSRVLVRRVLVRRVLVSRVLVSRALVRRGLAAPLNRMMEKVAAARTETSRRGSRARRRAPPGAADGPRRAGLPGGRGRRSRGTPRTVRRSGASKTPIMPATRPIWRSARSRTTWTPAAPISSTSSVGRARRHGPSCVAGNR